MSNRSSSSIIRTFTEIRQMKFLEEDKKKLHQFHEQNIVNRRDKFLKKANAQALQPGKQKANQIEKKAEVYKMLDDHRIPLPQFQKRYDTNLKTGLTQEQAARRIQKYGPNKLTEKQGVHWTIKLFREMVGPIALLFWAGAVLCFIAYGISSSDPSNMYLGLVLIGIVILTSLVTFYQNMKSEAIMASFKDFIPPQTIVIRGGIQKSLEATQLVPGDLIKIQLGKKIPADVRIIDSQGMKVDNSSLTGETQLLARSVQCTNPDNILQTKNIAFFSTLNRQGSGKGVVILTGDNTFIGLIANLASSAQTQQSPLNREMSRFISRLAIFSGTIGAVLFCIGFAFKYPPITNFIFAIGITVGNIPSGLLAEVTVGLSLTAKKLAGRKVLCKNLQAVQTLGSTTCICSDKTGTLTQNKMTACHLWYDGRNFEAASKQKNSAQYKFQYDTSSDGFKALCQCASVCSVANFDKGFPIQKSRAITENKSLTQRQKQQKLTEEKIIWEAKVKTMPYYELPTTGDASESALIKFFQPISDIVKTRERYPVVLDYEQKQCRLPFNSTNKYAFSINHHPQQNSEFCVYTKGAPQKIWNLCTHVLDDGVPVLKTQKWNQRFKQANIYFGKGGQRVLGFAKLHLSKKQYPTNFQFNIQNPNFPFKQQCFVGIVSLTDPPRQSVPFSVLKCQSAGIKVIMVTGDQPVTATAIARQCHIIREKTVHQIMQQQGITFDQAFQRSNAIVIHGDQITKMSIEDEGLPEGQQGKSLQKWLTKSQVVFARTSPAQKLIIVKGCQRAGEIVAVTGDGVNDSPAIKKADIGIAMGITGTDVAKDAADMILLNDDFSSIIIGVQQGRKIFDNLKKAICYALTSQVSEVAPFIGFIFFAYPLPVNTVILLYIDIGTDMIPAVSFAYEQGQIDIMQRKPRSKEDHLVSMKLMCQSYGYIGWIQFWGAMFAFYVTCYDFGFIPLQMNFKASIQITQHSASDVYNPNDKYFGNSNLKTSTNTCPATELLDWIYVQHASQDLRMAAVSCSMTNNGAQFQQIFKVWGNCNVQQISPLTNKPACYTTQGLKYGQSAYFYGVVVSQLLNAFVCKTRKQSVIYQGLNNKFTLFGLITQFCLVIICAYFQPFNIAFGTRDNIFMHFGIAAIPFSLFQIIFDEGKKFLIRTLPQDKKGRPNVLQRLTLW